MSEMINEKSIEKTLIYPGAGWDCGFLPFFRGLGYTKFILYDSMPKVSHYEKNQAGYPFQENLYGLLRCYLGKYIRKAKTNKLYFPEHNLTYYVSTDFNKLIDKNGNFSVEGDIYLRGMLPDIIEKLGEELYEDKMNKIKEFTKNRKIYLSNDTCPPTYFDDYLVVKVIDDDKFHKNIVGFMDKEKYLDYQQDDEDNKVMIFN
jgi:hypothetical protein